MVKKCHNSNNFIVKYIYVAQICQKNSRRCDNFHGGMLYLKVLSVDVWSWHKTILTYLAGKLLT